MSKHSFVCLSLGSNLGNRFENLQRARSLLSEHGIADLRSSVILETEALLLPGAPREWNLPYFNSVLVGNTELSLLELLSTVQRIEKIVGRAEGEPRWAPRVLDIDILLYGEESFCCDNNQIQVPHPSLLSRPFLISLIASLCPYRKFYNKCSPYHNFTFAELAHNLPSDPSSIRRSLSPDVLLMGVVNVTNNSMSDGGLFLEPEKAVAHAEELFMQGAAVIDFGAQATNPKVKQFLSVDEEWQRLEPILQLLAGTWSNKKQYPIISLDTFYPEIILRAMDIYPIQWINDVTGGSESMAKIAKDCGLCLVMNHSSSLPLNPKNTLLFAKPTSEQLLRWGKEQLEKFSYIGLDINQVIFDPGIGFGKSAVQSLTMLREIAKLRQLGCRILVGHSRKSFLSLIGNYDPKDRDWETIGLSVLLQKQGVDYLRVHNVNAHQKALSAAASFETCGYPS
ncbi:Dihydropteroate synthase,dihydropteroate synthase,dihydropteroate synthase,Pterin binding enzyme [Chlamydia serpentis]|uniref:Dihydropteroate synthase,dihydropteroate synthase,dihydropteroate synthase,Pterin binding enzyme n=1 Tax=Chlamydia serpentis TaxID=1967782 RepID=A0A2R8FBV1_9CHLA|nr:dihydropteroate synthase [Chlamydia serpentis]SPN73873.1 Dihydropteroate synthase,dihydropteroate synthase,dihydropteroate synthase,Pterin binding enzyme [Chlamydia serpentis]